MLARRQITNYQFKLALAKTEIEAYFSFREQIFCQEQGLFQNRDLDRYDLTAYPDIDLCEIFLS